jgi:hypothetical protein
MHADAEALGPHQFEQRDEGVCGSARSWAFAHERIDAGGEFGRTTEPATSP